MLRREQKEEREESNNPSVIFLRKCHLPRRGRLIKKPPIKGEAEKERAKKQPKFLLPCISIKAGQREGRPLPYVATPVYAGNKIFAQNQLLKLLLPSFLLEEKNGACFSLKKSRQYKKGAETAPFVLFTNCLIYLIFLLFLFLLV